MTAVRPLLEELLARAVELRLALQLVVAWRMPWQQLYKRERIKSARVTMKRKTMTGKGETWGIKRRDIYTSGGMIPMMAGKTNEAEGNPRSLSLSLSHVRESRWLYTKLFATHGSASVGTVYNQCLSQNEGTVKSRKLQREKYGLCFGVASPYGSLELSGVGGLLMSLLNRLIGFRLVFGSIKYVSSFPLFDRVGKVLRIWGEEVEEWEISTKIAQERI